MGRRKGSKNKPKVVEGTQEVREEVKEDVTMPEVQQ